MIIIVCVCLKMMDAVGRLVFLVLLAGLNLAGLSFIDSNLYSFIIGFLTPIIVLMADIPFSPYFPLILALLGIINLARVGGKMRND